MYIFLRCSSENYLKKFRNEGQIYCNSIQYFSNLSEEKGIGDSCENVYYQIYEKEKRLNVGVDNASQSTTSINVTDFYFKLHTPISYLNIFCLYSINYYDFEIGTTQLPVDEKFKDINSYCVLIKDTAEFIKRIGMKLQQLKMEYNCEFVEYIDLKKHNGVKTEFQKPIELSYQNEYRIAIETNSVEPFEFFIGSIEDISILVKTSELEHISISKSPI